MVEKGQQIEMRKDENNEERKLSKVKVSRWNEFYLIAFLHLTTKFLGVFQHLVP